jgi:hypothetical protein
VATSVEAEHRREQLPAEAAGIELRTDQVHGRDEVLEVRVLDDQPLVPVLVRAAADARLRLLRDVLEQLLQLVLGADEVA